MNTQVHLISVWFMPGASDAQGDLALCAITLQKGVTMVTAVNVTTRELDEQGAEQCWHQWHGEAVQGLPDRMMIETSGYIS